MRLMRYSVDPLLSVKAQSTSLSIWSALRSASVVSKFPDSWGIFLRFATTTKTGFNIYDITEMDGCIGIVRK